MQNESSSRDEPTPGPDSPQKAKKTPKPLSHEERISKAVHAHLFEHMSQRAAASLYNVPHSTVHDRAKGKHNRYNGQKTRELLTEGQNAALIEWGHYLSLTCHPINRRTIGPKVKAMTGSFPGVHWFTRWIDRHKEHFRFGKTSRLDSHRARQFNYTTVHEYFEKLDALMKEKGIPWENVWNMDEKGAQLGGGRKNRGRKFLLSRRKRTEKKKPNYRAGSSDLELVTIVECVNALGHVLKPGFVFQGKRIQKKWFASEEVREKVGS
jgi:hypothetical protein